MHPFDLPLLADENINPGVVEALREQGRDLCSITEEGLVPDWMI